MKAIIISLIVVYAFAHDFLNEFSGDVDYYDLGTMDRGKNAGSWHHSLTHNFDIFYYMSMQPWRHFVWTHIGTDEIWYKKTINEDYSVGPSSDKDWVNNEKQDFCQNEYGYPIQEFAIDWENAAEEAQNIEATTINGITCYVYPAKSPLSTIYLTGKFTESTFNSDSTSEVCRMDFIGGRTITFRSFNNVDMTFYSDYEKNTTSQCNIPVIENNIDTHLAIVYAISDRSSLKKIQQNLQVLSDLSTATSATIYYLTKTSYEKYEVIKNDNGLILSYGVLSIIEIVAGSPETLISAAVSDLTEMINNNEIKRGTLVVLMDKTPNYSFSAYEYDRLNITAHTLVLNKLKSSLLTKRALSLVSSGYHYHEINDPTTVTTALNELFEGIRANLTERCDRDTCNGFCDAKNRCTCPMCCENDCYYSYCDVSTATCKPWPKKNPIKKVECPSDCIGEYECVDLVGCVVSSYNDSCNPAASCLSVYCDDNDSCQFKDNCEQDTTPTDGYCYSKVCDEETGLCKKDYDVHGNACPSKGVCEEYYCDDDLNCKVRDKTCVKTSPYIEYTCYTAVCNEETGMCENKLACDTYSSCGGSTSGDSICYCNSTSNYQCVCEQTVDGIYCDSSLDEVCDYTQSTPACVTSACPLDIVIQSCMIRLCNDTTGDNYWDFYNCTVDESIVDDVCESITYSSCEEEGGCTHYLRNSGIVDCYQCVVNDDNSVTATELCSGTTDIATQKCSNNTCYYEQNTECEEYYQDVLSCSDSYTYTFNSTSGLCTYTLPNSIKFKCQICDSDTDSYVSYCSNKTLERQVTIGSTEYTYYIPYICTYASCVPNYNFNCKLTDMYTDLLNVCLEDQISVEYHYSSNFDYIRYALSMNQTDAFYEEMVDEAYCVFTVSETTLVNCSYCVPTETFYKTNTTCNDEVDGIPIICESNECVPDPDYQCEPENCVVYGRNETTSLCSPVLDRCQQYYDSLEAARANITETTLLCGDVECLENNTCKIQENTSNCYRQPGVDYGCTVPYYETDDVEFCIVDDGSYVCNVKTLTLEDEEDEWLDGIYVDNACYEYSCVEQETVDENGNVNITHYWELVSQITYSRRHYCEVASCDPETAEAVYTDVTCTIEEDFPGLTENYRKCFYCECSVLTGNLVLQMYDDNDEEIYVVDYCGYCKIYNASNPDQQINDTPYCDLGDVIIVDGLAASATIAAVGSSFLIALIVLAIGTISTYKLVKSARKNIVNRVENNAAFEPADTNVNNENYDG
ncbi:Galactose/N-acetyl-D-galactosamine lectin heavy subunit 2 [Entamoeba marina]